MALAKYRNRFLPLLLIFLWIATVAVFSGCGGRAKSNSNIPGYGGEIPAEPNYAKPPAGDNQTLLQGFYWEMNTGAYAGKYPEEANLWNLLASRAGELANAGVTAVWLPPANKGMAGASSVGYDTYDLWDLGEFNQKGSTRTKYGTKAELLSAIGALHGAGIKVYYDAVLNHRMGADQSETVPLADGGSTGAWTGFTFAGRNGAYYPATWNWRNFNSADGRLFEGKSWNDSFDEDYLMGSNVDYTVPAVRDELDAWGDWIINTIGCDGFRLDAIKHVSSSFTNHWIESVRGKSPAKNPFFVGEAWFEERSRLKAYLAAVSNSSLRVFDFPLRAVFAQLSGSGGGFNLATLAGAGLVNDPGDRDRAVTFVDSHDTDRDGQATPIRQYKYQAYAYILLREHGIPDVFWKDFYTYGMKEGLTRLLKARKYFAYGPGYEVSNNDNDVYGYVRAGDGSAGRGLVLLIADGPAGGTGTAVKSINSRQPNTTYYDYTGHFTETVTTDANGYAEFKVKLNAADGWSIWVPVL